MNTEFRGKFSFFGLILLLPFVIFFLNNVITSCKARHISFRFKSFGSASFGHCAVNIASTHILTFGYFLSAVGGGKNFFFLL